MNFQNWLQNKIVCVVAATCGIEEARRRVFGEESFEKDASRRMLLDLPEFLNREESGRIVIEEGKLKIGKNWLSSPNFRKHSSIRTDENTIQSIADQFISSDLFECWTP